MSRQKKPLLPPFMIIEVTSHRTILKMVKILALLWPYRSIVLYINNNHKRGHSKIELKYDSAIECNGP